MKKFLVSLVAILICASFFAIALAFGYFRYKAAQSQNAAAGAALVEAQSDPGALTRALTGHVSDGQFEARMPAQISSAPRAGNTEDRLQKTERYDQKSVGETLGIPQVTPPSRR